MSQSKMIVFASFVATMTVVSSTPGGADGKSAGERWWSHVAFLADDTLEGRNTGSDGHRKAADYVAEQFKRSGLKPAGTSGYMQSVKFRSRRILEEQSSLAIVRNGRTEPVVLGDEATFNMRIEPAASIEAPIVFAGYGLTVPDLGYDDLKGLDLAGKIVLHLSGGPSNIPGPLLAHYQQAGERWVFLKRAGAIGAISIQNPKGADIPWERSALARLMPQMALADASLDDTAGQQLSVTVNPARAEKFFTGSAHSFQEILSLSDQGKPLPTFQVPASIKATVTFETMSVESQNVVGRRGGTDATLKNEHVALSAHLDHIGVGEPIKGDRINNGAMDNASGIATLLEIARSLEESKKRLRRSILFVAVTAEEKGLLGSKYFASHPTIKPGAIVANVNFDMFLPLFPLRSLVPQGLNESDLGVDLRSVAAPLGIEVLDDPEPERRAFTRSDQYSFIRRGVPALSMKVGFAKDSPEHAIVRRWRAERYHAPSDDLNQPVDLEAAVRFNTVMALLTEAIANRAQRPRWNPDSFFRRFATSN